MIHNKKIGFIGAGNMAEAIAEALYQISCKDLSFSDINQERTQLMKNKYNGKISKDNTILFDNSDIVILAVKPQNMNSVLSNININSISKHKLIISIAAGVKISTIESILYSKLDDISASKFPIVRVMPNTPALVLSGISGIAYNKYVNFYDTEITRFIFKSMGEIVEVKEEQMDAVTAISGSGPAYVFYFIEALIDGAKEMGFSDNDAYLLTYKTFEGALNLLKKQNEKPHELRKKVTSPGGTTEAAIKSMKKANIAGIIISAVKEAEKRSRELSDLF